MKPLHWTSPFQLRISRSSGTIFTVNIIAFKADRVFFYMLTKNFQRLKTEVTAHVSADRVAQGSYETCFIGCLANGHDNPEFIERTYGIPLMVTRIAESIFEGLRSNEAILFFAAIPQAIGSDGKDLSRVGWKFLAEELRALQPVPDDIQACIDPVINGIDLLAEGKEWPKAAACSAARAADAARAAARAARAADARAADAAYADAYTAAAAAAAATAARDADAYTAWSAPAAARAATRAAYAYAAAAAATATAATAARDAYSYAYAAARLRERDLLLRLVSEAPVSALI